MTSGNKKSKTEKQQPKPPSHSIQVVDVGLSQKELARPKENQSLNSARTTVR